MLKNEAHVDDSAGMPPLNWSQQFFLLQKKKNGEMRFMFHGDVLVFTNIKNVFESQLLPSLQFFQCSPNVL